MSDSRTWSPPPDFKNAPRGYWGYEVDRLIGDLEAAHRAGEKLGPIIAERKLSEVGFGYDMADVDAYLNSLPGGQGARETVESAGDSSSVTTSRPSAPQQTRPSPPPPPVRPAPQAPVTRAAPSPVEPATPSPEASAPWARPTPAPPRREAEPRVPTASPDEGQNPQEPALPQPGYEVLEPYVPPSASSGRTEWSQTWTGNAAAMLAEIRRGRMLPAPGHMETGYDARSVNQFLSQLDVMVQNNQSISEALQNCRLNFARQGTPSYAIRDVDALLNSLKRLATDTGLAAGAAHTPRSSVQITRTTNSTRRTAIAARIIRIVGFVIFAFVIYAVFLT